MITYQFGYMYGRYFMWNFVGRQDDIQGNLDNHGNWLSGINFIDEFSSWVLKKICQAMIVIIKAEINITFCH